MKHLLDINRCFHNQTGRHFWNNGLSLSQFFKTSDNILIHRQLSVTIFLFRSDISRDVISFLGDGYEFSQGNCLILKLVKKNRYLHDAGHQHIVIIFSYN